MSNRVLVDKPHLKSNFSQFSNEMLRDKSLSWAAQGILTYLLSLHPDFNITLEHLASIRSNGRDATRRALTELEQAGYLKRTRLKGEKGKFEKTEWIVRSCPIDYPISDMPKTDNPPLEKPSTDLPKLVEPPHINTIQNTKTNNIKTTTAHSAKSNSTEDNALILPSLLSKSQHSGALRIVANIPPADAQLLLDELEDVLERGANKKPPLAWLSGIKKVFDHGQYNPVGALRIANKREHQPSVSPTNNNPKPATPSSAVAGNHAITKMRKCLQQSGAGGSLSLVKHATKT